MQSLAISTATVTTPLCTAAHVTRTLVACCLVLLASIAATATVRAEPAARAEALVPQLTYSAPHGCPSQAAFERRLSAKLRSARETHAPAPPLTLTVRLTRRMERAVGELVLEDGQRAPTRRRIEAESCVEAMDAIAFVAVLLLEQRRKEIASAPPSVPAPTLPMTPDVGSLEELPKESVEAARTRREAEEARESEAQEALADQESTVEATPAPAARTEVQPPRTRRARREPSAKREPLKVHGELLPSALLITGIAPAARPALGITGALGVARFSLRAGWRASADHTERTDEGTGRFGFWTTTAAVCSEAGGRGRRLGGALCGMGELGRLRARGDDTAAPRQLTRRWLGLGARIHAWYRPLGPLIVEPGVELLVPLARDRFELGNELLHRVPSLTFRLELALGVRFE